VKVHVFTICWNEEVMLPYYFRHYEPFVDRFFVFDDGSTDRTLAMLEAHPKVTVLPWERADDTSYALSQQQLSNRCWKESRGQADWVLVCDVDEHFFHPDLPGYLERCRAEGVTMIPATGYQMVSEKPPPFEGRLCDSVRRGVRFDMFDKMSFFNPDAIQRTAFWPGRHVLRPLGDIRHPERTEMKLLHYKLLGLDHVLERAAALRDRLGPTDVENNYCHHWREDEVRDDFARFLDRAEQVV
jgi:glycosyltransferase involved in cell wall biosynthesis